LTILFAEVPDSAQVKIKQRNEVFRYASSRFDITPQYLKAIVFVERILNYDFYNPPPDTGTIHILFNDGTGNFVEDPVVGIMESEPPVTSGYELYQNYPNPFNSTTMISYYLGNNCPYRIGDL